MWIADGWKDYEIIDTSDGEKLERWIDVAGAMEKPAELKLSAGGRS